MERNDLTYKPMEPIGNETADRIFGLRENRGWTREELAAKVGIDKSTQGKIENGDIASVKDDLIRKYAQVFGCSADYLLGITDIEDKKHYELEELGLSYSAAKRIVTSGMINKDVMNMLLSHEQFPVFTQLIAGYFIDSISPAAAVRNFIFSSVSNDLLRHAEHEDDPDKTREMISMAAGLQTAAASDPDSMVPVIRMLENILADLKKSVEENIQPTPELTKRILNEMYMQANLRSAKSRRKGEKLTSRQQAKITVDVVAKYFSLTDEQKDSLTETLELLLEDPGVLKETSGEKAS